MKDAGISTRKNPQNCWLHDKPCHKDCLRAVDLAEGNEWICGETLRDLLAKTEWMAVLGGIEE